MSGWTTLFLKELRENRGFFLFLIGATIIVEAVAVAGAGDGSDQHLQASFSILKAPMYAMLGLLPYASALILPLVLYNSLNSELKAQTHYLLLSLPLPRSVILLAKYLAVVAVSVVIFLITTAAVYLIYAQMLAVWTARFPQLTETAPAPGSLLPILATAYFTVLLLLLGLVSVAEGVKFAVRRHRGLATSAGFIGGIYLFAELREPAMNLLTRTGLGPIDAFASYAVVASLLFLGIGGWLFERHVEV